VIPPSVKRVTGFSLKVPTTPSVRARWLLGRLEKHPHFFQILPSGLGPVTTHG